MSHYIDAVVVPVPHANLDTYKRMSWGGFETIIGLAPGHQA
jgi:uncharacterized protein YbaA (DUF1428 family)